MVSLTERGEELGRSDRSDWLSFNALDIPGVWGARGRFESSNQPILPLLISESGNEENVIIILGVF